MSSHGSSCWPPMRRGKNPARSLGGICKAQNSLRTSGTLMYQTSLALNRQSSYLQQAPLVNDGKRKQREQMNTTTGFDSSANLMTLPCVFFGGRNLNSFQAVVYGGIHHGSPKCRCNYRRWIDGWM